MKFYSETLDKMFNSMDACIKAEKEYERKIAAEKAEKEKRKAEYDERYKKLMEASKEYQEVLEAFLRDYPDHASTYFYSLFNI